MEPLIAAQAACRARLPQDHNVDQIAELITMFLVFGQGWKLTLAVKQGDDRLLLRLASLPLPDYTSRLLRFHDFNNALSIAVMLGDMELARTLVTIVPNARVTTAIGVAARSGQLRFLTWLSANTTDACWGGTEMTKAAHMGHLGCLLWLQANTVRLGPQRLLPHAARHLSPDILNWVLATRGEQPELADLIVAVEHGRLQNLEILTARMIPPLRIPADPAARNGHLHIIKWLHVNGGVFTVNTMNVAAQYGHLDVFLWLHENRAEGCSARAVSLAAMNGHLGVIRWIIHNMPHSVLPGTLHFAIGCNQLKVAKWLHEQVQADWEGNLVESATHYGSRELATWAANLFPEQCTPAATDISGYTELFLAFHHAN